MSEQKKLSFECSLCKSRNYIFFRSLDKAAKALSLNKFCKYCQKHTLHVQAK